MHSSIDGHFSCSHLLATLNNAAMNIGVHISFQIFVFFRKIPRSRLLDCICCCCLVAKSYLTLCDPMFTCSPGSSVHGIFQARILGWVVMPFSRGSSHPRDRTRVSCIGGRCFTVWATWEAYSFMPGHTEVITFQKSLKPREWISSQPPLSHTVEFWL